MIDYKLLRIELKQNYTQQNVAQMLSFVGYEINRSHKFKLRDESTPSASISRNGSVTDFGSGWSGDIVALLTEHRNIPLSEATTYISKLMNIDVQRFEK